MNQHLIKELAVERAIQVKGMYLTEHGYSQQPDYAGLYYNGMYPRFYPNY